MNPPKTDLTLKPSPATTTILNTTGAFAGYRNMPGFASLINLKDEVAITRGRRIQISQLGVTASNKPAEELRAGVKKRWSFHTSNQISEILKEDTVMKPISSPKRRKSSGSALVRSTSETYVLTEEDDEHHHHHRRHRMSQSSEQSQSSRPVLTSHQSQHLSHRHRLHQHHRGRLISLKGDGESSSSKRRQRLMDEYVMQVDPFPTSYHQFRLRKSKYIREPPPPDRLSPMPDEVLLRVFKHLPKASLANLSRVSHRFLGLIQDESLWKRLCVMSKILEPEHLLTILARKPMYLRMARTGIPDPTDLPNDLSTIASHSQLSYLDLSSATITPSTLALIMKISPNLVKLSLEHLTVTKEVLESMSFVATIEVLNLTMCYELDAKVLAKFLSSCQRLMELNLGCIACDWGVEELTTVVKALPGTLQLLNISGFRHVLDNSHVTIIVNRCPKLIELDISDSQQVNGQSVDDLLKLNYLQHLGLSRCCGIEPPAYTLLANHKSLKFLNLFALFKENSLKQLSAQLSGIEINKFPFSAIARPTVGNKRSSIWLQRVRG